MTGITKLTVGKGRTREATDGKAWVREYYELEVAVDDASDVEVTRANALGLIDGWLSKSNRTQEAVRQGVTEKAKEETKASKPTADEIGSLKYVDKTSDKGPYKTASKTDNTNNLAFLKLQKYLQDHNNFAILHGFKFWTFSNNQDILGRRKQ